MKKRTGKKLFGTLAIGLGIVFVALVAAVFIWTIATQKIWTDFKQDFADASASGAGEIPVLAEGPEGSVRLHAENCTFLYSYLVSMNFQPGKQDALPDPVLTLHYPGGDKLYLAPGENDTVLLQFVTAEGRGYCYAIGEDARWKTTYQLLTIGFSYKNEPVSADSP